MSDNLMNKPLKDGKRCVSQCGTTVHETRSPLDLPPEVIETIRRNVCGELPDADLDRRAEESGCIEDDNAPYVKDGKPMKLIWNDGGEEFEVQLKVQPCGSGNLSIVLLYWNEDFWDIWTSVTIELDFCDEDCAYIDTRTNGEEILDWLEQNKLAVRTGASYCLDGWSYPMYQFDSEALWTFDLMGYERYLEYLGMGEDYPDPVYDGAPC